MDIPEEDLVYVPSERKSTIERLAQEGFIPDAEITLKDVWGTHANFRVMKRKPSLSRKPGD